MVSVDLATSDWLLLRGLSREGAHWGPFLSQLRRRFPQARIHRPDLPGTGLLWQSTSPLRVEAIAARLRREHFERQGNSPKPAFCVAMSLGAMVALEWAYRWPQDFRGLVLINVTLGGICPPWLRLTPVALGSIMRILADSDVQRREEEILRLTVEDSEHIGEWSSAWAEVQRLRPVRRRTALRQLVAGARYRGRPKPPALPLLLLSSAKDKLADPRCSLAIARTWGVPLRQHANCGHDLPLEDPAWCFEHIEMWAKRQ